MKAHLKGRTWTIGFLSHSQNVFHKVPGGFLCCLIVCLFCCSCSCHFGGFVCFCYRCWDSLKTFILMDRKCHSSWKKGKEKKRGEVTGGKSTAGFFETSWKPRRKLHRKKNKYSFAIRKKKRFNRCNIYLETIRFLLRMKWGPAAVELDFLPLILFNVTIY